MIVKVKIQHYLASDGEIINANIIYLKKNKNLIIGSFLGYEGHGNFSDSLFIIKNNKITLTINIFELPKSIHKIIEKLDKFRTKFESKKELGNLSTLGKKLKNSDDTQQFDTHWEYGTEEFDFDILKKLSKKWSLSIKW